MNIDLNIGARNPTIMVFRAGPSHIAVQSRDVFMVCVANIPLKNQEGQDVTAKATILYVDNGSLYYRSLCSERPEDVVSRIDQTEPNAISFLELRDPEGDVLFVRPRRISGMAAGADKTGRPCTVVFVRDHGPEPVFAEGFVEDNAKMWFDAIGLTEDQRPIFPHLDAPTINLVMPRRASVPE